MSTCYSVTRVSSPSVRHYHKPRQVRGGCGALAPTIEKQYKERRNIMAAIVNYSLSNYGHVTSVGYRFVYTICVHKSPIIFTSIMSVCMTIQTPHGMKGDFPFRV